MPENRLFELSLDLLAVAGFDGYFKRVNPAWTRILGWAEDELLATPYLDLFHPDDVERSVEELAKLTTTGQNSEAVEVRLRCKDGTYRWIRGSVHPDLDQHELMVSAADVTDRKRIEEQLGVRIALEELVSANSSRLLTVDPSALESEVENGLGRLAAALGADSAYLLRLVNGTIAHPMVEWCAPGVESRGWNIANVSRDVLAWWEERLRAGEQLKATSLDELRGTVPPEVVEVLERAGTRSLLVVPLQMRRAIGLVSLVTVTHERDFADDATGLLRVAGESFLAAFERADADLALLDAARELELRNHELERSNEDLERFAFTAAHDLKAPLARIEMAVSALDMYATDLSDDHRALFDVAKRAAERMRQLIEDLLSYATAGGRTSVPEKVDLSKVAEQVRVDLADVVRETGGSIEIGPMPELSGHASMLGLLLQNLVANALKFRREGVPPVVRITAERTDGNWVISVEDNGIGIPDDKHDAVFAMFTRLHTDDRYSGSGIGLATCAKVVALHSGHIWVESSPSGGSIFRVSLPA